jgi:DNA polymerase
MIDVESRSRADLRAVGGRRYWEHPSSEILVLCWYDVATGERGDWRPGDPWPFADRVLAAHNAHGFDRFAVERYSLPCAGWIDTAHLAKRAGLPGALDALGSRWADVPKDREASRFTKSLSSVKRPTRTVLERGDPMLVVCPKCSAVPAVACTTPKGAVAKRPHRERVNAATLWDEGVPADVWRTLTPEQKREQGVYAVAYDADAAQRVRDYCRSDVEIMERAWSRLEPWLDVDADVERVSNAINDRGVRFDVDLAQRLLGEDQRLATAAIDAVAVPLGLPRDVVALAARSPAQFCAITGAPDARADTVEALDHPLADVRKALASIAAGKLRAGIARVHDDGRLRDTLRYYGAHTGRWSGAGMQLQNMPRPAKHYEDLPADTTYPHTINAKSERVIDVDAFATQVLAGRACTADDVALLVRATICASDGHALVQRDFASVEARGTAWMAGDHAALDVFRSGRDPYKVAAGAIFGVAYDDVTKPQRQVGKVSELACGYQGGTGAFEAVARVYKLDLSGVDTQAIVDAWRRLHAPIVSLWYDAERAFRSAIRGRPCFAGACEYAPARDGSGAIACILPSGRPITYNDATEDDGGLVFTGVRGRERTYGGKLIENAVQGLCRDLLGEALVEAEDVGLRPVLTVHDEIVCDVPAGAAPEAERALHDAMTRVPSWARGMPIDADGWVGERYRK